MKNKLFRQLSRIMLASSLVLRLSLPGMHADAEEAARLTQIDYSRPDGSVSQCVFEYDQENMLKCFTADFHFNSESNHLKFNFYYDENGKLVKYQSEGSTVPEAEYEYAPDGRLISSKTWEPDSGESQYQYEYNEQGQLVRRFAEETGSATTYRYNSRGLIAASSEATFYGDMVGKVERTYTYDAFNRKSEITVSADWGFGSITMDSFRYCYDYAPFMLESEYSDGRLMNVSLLYEEPTSGHVFSFSLGINPTFECRDGRLSSVNWDDGTFIFTYAAPQA